MFSVMGRPATKHKPGDLPLKTKYLCFGMKAKVAYIFMSEILCISIENNCFQRFIFFTNAMHCAAETRFYYAIESGSNRAESIR